MEFYIKTLDFLERVMNGVMAIDPGQQPFISQDLEELNEMRDSLLKASGQAERSHEAKAALPLHDVSNHVCPYCGSTKVIAWGEDADKCQDCKLTWDV